MTKKLTLLVVLMTILSGSLVMPVPNAMASTAGFKAGDIIDDTVMTDSDSMTVTDIKNFLKSKVPSCDTNGSKQSEMNNSGVPDYNNNGSIQRWEWGKKKYGQTTFKCLKDYTQGGKTAAKIIHDKAQEYTINPRVLLVLLQKEQGLITDTWPLNIQYRSATGYGCPDTAACDSEYYGFSNQVDWAATMFRAILNDSPTWYTPYEVGNNSIPWNPNTSACGYSTVNIQNRATQALYNYTPYRPNQAALNAGYGTGNSCSSYGNRNFYLYFTDWFGSTTIPMFKINGGGATVYLNYGDYYYAIPSPDILKAWGLAGKKVTSVDASQLSSYTQGPSLSRVVKFGASATVYLADGGNVYPVPSWPTLGLYDYTSGDLKTYSDENLKSMFSTKSSLTKLVRKSSGAIFYLDSDGKHVFPDYKTFSSKALELAGTTQYSTFSNSIVDPITNSYPVLSDGVAVKTKDSAAIYLHDGDSLWSFDPDSWKAWGYNLDYKLGTIATLTEISTGGSVPLLVTNGSTKYVVSYGKKYSMSTGVQAEWGLDDGDFQLLTNKSLSRLSNAGSIGTLVRQSNGAVYRMDGGDRLIVPSMQDFKGNGYKWSNVTNVNNTIISLVSTGSSYYDFAPGSLIRTPNGAVYWTDEGFTAHTIPSSASFDSFGFSWKDVRNYSSNALDGYTTSTLLNLLSAGGKYYLADRGDLLTIDNSTYDASQYNFTGSAKSTLGTTLISKLGIDGVLTQFIKGSNYTVYKVAGGEKGAISTPQSLFNEGGGWGTVTRVSDEFLATLPTGTGY